MYLSISIVWAFLFEVHLPLSSPRLGVAVLRTPPGDAQVRNAIKYSTTATTATLLKGQHASAQNLQEDEVRYAARRDLPPCASATQ